MLRFGDRQRYRGDKGGGARVRRAVRRAVQEGTGCNLGAVRAAQAGLGNTPCALREVMGIYPYLLSGRARVHGFSKRVCYRQEGISAPVYVFSKPVCCFRRTTSRGTSRLPHFLCSTELGPVTRGGLLVPTLLRGEMAGARARDPIRWVQCPCRSTPRGKRQYLVFSRRG